MLTKAGLLILGIVDEKPLNPYGIIKQMDNLIIKELFPISVSSVYTTIRTLNEKGFISGKKLKGVNLPDKTVYSITEQGEIELTKSIVEYFDTIDFDPVKMHIAGFMIYHLKKDDAINTLKSRINKLKKYEIETNSKLKQVIDNGTVPDIVVTVIKHNINLVGAELKTAEELYDEVNLDSKWL